MSDSLTMRESTDETQSMNKDSATHVISIVDDDPSFRGAMARLMRSLGHLVVAFDSAEDFLKSERMDETECLICDVRMPRMSGIDLQKDLMAKGYRFPIIFVTAHPMEGARKDALAAGAIGFLHKPCNEETLIALLELALNGRGPTR
jgi:FixJ family two-component response regulator